MSATAVLAIVVAASEARTPEVVAAVAAVSEVVGADGAVRLIAVPAISDGEVSRVERAFPVPATVQVAWRDAGRLDAHLRLHATRTDRWIERELTFISTDQPTERGRTLGFAIASMLPEGDPNLGVTATEVAAAPPPEMEPPGRRALALSFIAATGLGGPAGGLGATALGEVFLADRLSIGASASARFGRIEAIDADALTASFGVGAAWWLLPATATQRFGLGLRAEALVLYQAVSHDRIGGGNQWKGQAFPGAAARLEATWRVSRAVEVLAATGTELAFGTIDVTVAPPAAMAGSVTIPVVRALAEMGLRARF